MTRLLRLNQAVARTGICSRRKADDLIAQGKIQVNGEIVTDFARQVDPEKDWLLVDGELACLKAHVCVALHKPAGYVTTTADEKNRPTVLDLLPARLGHLRPVGRLDMDSEGLLLLTNDGDLAQRLSHPSRHVGKLYRVTVSGEMTDSDLKRLASGILLEDGMTSPAKVNLRSRSRECTELDLTLQEGRNRQIRRMCKALGFKVTRLVRLAIGRLQLGQMNSGSWRYLTDAEVKLLFPERTE